MTTIRELRALRAFDLAAAGRCYSHQAFSLGRAYMAHAKQAREDELKIILTGDSARLRAMTAPVYVTNIGPYTRPAPRLAFDAGDGAIRATASRCAALCLEAMERAPGDMEAVAAGRNICAAHGVEPPRLKDGQPVQPALLRMACSRWWRRRLRCAVARRVEAREIGAGRVHVKAASYCSDLALYRRRQQVRRNSELMELMEATNEAGDTFSLGDLAAKSTSNPELRRNELMTRVRGLEEIAQARGDIGLFVTQTLPSRFHAINSKTGQRNPVYEGASPREGQAALCRVWAQQRALLAKADFRVYGLRVAEPHTDGTPHHHSLIFVAAEELRRVRQIIRDKALEDSGSEKGAQRHRVTFEVIDPDKGSAVGYIAKYLAKNVDGHQLEVTITRGQRGELEMSGDQPQTAAERIRAWASTWGIRQFQFFGSPPISWWRELRRLESEPLPFPVIEAARAPADEGNYASHVRAAGGVCVSRKNLSLCTYAPPVIESSGSGLKLNRYSELSGSRTIGIQSNDGTGQRVITRFHQWRVTLKAPTPALAPWTRVNNCNRAEDQPGFVPLVPPGLKHHDSRPHPRPPW